jgi:hypothetical protein
VHRRGQRGAALGQAQQRLQRLLRRPLDEQICDAAERTEDDQKNAEIGRG